MGSDKIGFAPSVSELARLCRVHRSTVQSWMRDPAFPQKQADGFDLFEVGQWKGARDETQKQAERQPKAKAFPQDADPLLSGYDSPGLERYRLAKAGIAELDLRERQGELMNVAEVREFLDSFADILRRASEQLQRQFGRDALLIVTQAIAVQARKYNIFFKTDDEPTNESESK